MTKASDIPFVRKFLLSLRSRNKAVCRFAAVCCIIAIISAYDLQPEAAAVAVSASTAPGTSATADILIEAFSGTVLHEKNADKHMLIASTTKIVTAAVVLEQCDVTEKVIIGQNFPAVEGSSIYLKPGEEVTVLDLLYGLLLESGNDAAVALALHVSGSIEAFSVLMNDYAKRLGCSHSNFCNPHGLDQKDHFSSARDLSIIAANAMENKTFREIVSTKSISLAGRYFKNHNKLLWTCPGIVGIKTGFTESAGRSLVSSAERDGMRLICVTLSAPNDWKDHNDLYNWAYREFGCISISIADENYGFVPVISGEKEQASVHPAADYHVVYNKSDIMEVSWTIPKFAYAAVYKNDIAGIITITKNGEAIKEIPLVFGETVVLDSSIPLKFLEKVKRSILGRVDKPAINLNTLY